MLTHMSESSAPDQGPKVILSLGRHKDEVQNYINHARRDSIFTPLMVDAGLIPSELKHAKMLPGVTYGIDATRPTPAGAVELLPGSSNLLEENLGTPYFNPHLSIRTRAHNLMKMNNLLASGKGSKRVRGATFGLPSYWLELDNADKLLFVGGTESDLDILQPEFAKKLARAYSIGHVILGSKVVVGDVKINLSHVSLPTLVREIGHTIADYDLAHEQKVRILQEAHHSYEEGKSPDYRPYLKHRKNWPKHGK